MENQMKKALRALLPALLVACLAVATPAFATSLDNFSITDGETGAVYTFSLAANPNPPSIVTASYFEMTGVTMLVNGVSETGNVFFEDSSNAGGAAIFGTTITLDDVGVGNAQLFTGMNNDPTFDLGTFTLLNDSHPTVAADDASVTISSAAAPEPSSFILLGTGVLGLAGVVRRRLAI
jgi:hypothetical protein